MSPKKRPLAERFWEKVDRRGPDECWPWTGCINRKTGYGSIYAGTGARVLRYAHHVALEVFGRLSSTPSHRVHVRHSCDNPRCVNPQHLKIGTAQDNMQDREDRGRHAHDVSHIKKKITPELIRMVQEVREAAEAGEFHGSIAARLGVGRTTIWRIVNRKRWAAGIP